MKDLNLEEQIRLRQAKLKEKIDAVPKINWEILGYANTHTKEEVLEKYPEHRELIDSIVFGDRAEEFTYPGYMSEEAQDFFKGHVKQEQRDGMAVIGSFIRLADGSTVLPSKNDVFIKDSAGILKKSGS